MTRGINTWNFAFIIVFYSIVLNRLNDKFCPGRSLSQEDKSNVGRQFYTKFIRFHKLKIMSQIFLAKRGHTSTNKSKTSLDSGLREILKLNYENKPWKFVSGQETGLDVNYDRCEGDAK